MDEAPGGRRTIKTENVDNKRSDAGPKRKKKTRRERKETEQQNSEGCQGDIDPFVSVLLSIGTVVGPFDVDKGELNKRN